MSVRAVRDRSHRALRGVRRGCAALSLSLSLSLSLVAGGCDDGGGGGGAGDGADVDASVEDTTQPQDTLPVVDAAVGLEARPANPTCVAPAQGPAPAGEIALERVFADVSLSQPIFMTQAPGDPQTFYVVERAGRIVRLPGDAVGERSLAVDISERVDDGPGEGGLLGMAFHPDFPARAEVFVSYTRGGPLTSRVSRFAFDPATRRLDPDSEVVILEVAQPYSNHNGGGVGFGPDGMLYVGLGDGGSGGDPDDNGQNTDTLHGAMLRIDVDAPGEAPYAIPADNPFAGGGGAPELYAWGLRNPWRWSFDRVTGELWVGDVGQNAWEEINRVERGGNYGWRPREGFGCYEAATCEGDFIDPVVALPQSGGDRSITGGYVYRGAALAGHVGTYFFGDFVSGNLYRIAHDEEGEPYADLLTSTPLGIAAFAEGLDGELYVVDYGGTIQKLVAADPAPDSDFPTALSATGCVDPADPRQPAPGLIPYAPTAELWSDGAAKRRWMALPDGATLTLDEAGQDFEFPIGAVFVKTFELAGAPVETRLFMRHADGSWAGYSYAWNDAGTDATLLEGSWRRELASGDAWTYPSRGQCMQCHTAPAGFVLGAEVAQLNAHLAYPDLAAGVARRANQLATWDHIGLIDGGLGADPTALPALPDPLDEASGDLERRARAYLHANCASCHQPGARVPVDMDLRHHVALSEARVCDVAVAGHTLGLSEARRVAPGDATRSVLVRRMAEEGLLRMPQIGTAQVHGPAVDLVEAWINALTGCP